MIELSALEYHLAHGCNLSCQQCSHYSNFRLAGAMPTPAEAQVEYETWNHRIRPQRFALLGGEPLLNPNLIEHLHLARKCWPHSNLMLVTNGFFFDRHPALPDTLTQTDCRLEVSQHGTHEAYLSKLRKAKQVVWRWREEYPGIQIKIRQSHRGWMRQYRIEDGKPMPFDSTPQAAYKICMQKTCTQLFKQRLWKCPALAYWSQLEQRLNLEEIPEWQLFRDYQGCSSECSDAELLAFFARRQFRNAGCAQASGSPFIILIQLKGVSFDELPSAPS